MRRSQSQRALDARPCWLRGGAHAPGSTGVRSQRLSRSNPGAAAVISPAQLSECSSVSIIARVDGKRKLAGGTDARVVREDTLPPSRPSRTTSRWPAQRRAHVLCSLSRLAYKVHGSRMYFTRSGTFATSKVLGGRCLHQAAIQLQPVPALRRVPQRPRNETISEEVLRVSPQTWYLGVLSSTFLGASRPDSTSGCGEASQTGQGPKELARLSAR